MQIFNSKSQDVKASRLCRIRQMTSSGEKNESVVTFVCCLSKYLMSWCFFCIRRHQRPLYITSVDAAS